MEILTSAGEVFESDKTVNTLGHITAISHTGLSGELSTEIEEVASIFLQVDGRTVATVHPQKRFEFNLGRHLAPNEKVEVLILSRGGQQSRVLEWGFSGPPLPDEWHERMGAHPHPSLFLLGAAKSATTSLHFWLDAHPDIFMSRPKEPFFFEAEYERGVEFYFRKYFSTWSGQRVVGESRHRNLYLPFVPSRIHRFNKDAKLLVVLRDPVERAVSHWWHWRSQKMEPLSLAEALRADMERIAAGHKFTTEEDAANYAKVIYQDFRSPHKTYMDSGYYAEQIERYIALFGRNRLHVVLFEDLVARPAAVMEGIFRFLDVDPTFASRISYSAWHTSPPGALQALDRHTEAWLIEHYEPHNRQLERLLGRPCYWNRSFKGSPLWNQSSL